jgi:hypothetical protein
MRRLSLLLSCVALSAAMSWAQPAGPSVSFGLFYSSLGQYGEWMQVGGGVYAWHPAGVSVGWKPYLDGRWLWTDDGWFWASQEPWGWATYHYGRWYYDDYYGWVWVPGYEWAPAWVEWRYGGGCIGWAPLSPYAVFSVGWGIHYLSHWNTPAAYWTFVDCRYVNRPHINDYVYRDRDNSRWIGRTRGAGSIGTEGGRIISRGPARDYVERTGNVRVHTTGLTTVNDRNEERFVRGANGGEQYNVYRPRVREGNVRGEPTRPQRVLQGNRPLSLDLRRTDIGRRNVARDEGRDLRRAEEYRRRQFETARPEFNRPEMNRQNPAPAERNTPRQWMDERGQRDRNAGVGQVPQRRTEPPHRSTTIERRSDRTERTMRQPSEHRSPAPRDGNRTTGHGRGGTRR